MKTFKFLTLLVLGLAIFGSAGYFGYELFIKPSRVEKKARALEAAAPAPKPTPDPGIPEFQRLKALQTSGQLMQAREGWNAWIAANNKSPLVPEAFRLLGAANMELLFQPSGNPATITYTVIKGDSLAKIASKHRSNAELIQKANQLSNINLQIGEQLLIPSLNASLELDRSAKTLTLLNNGQFLKQFTLLSAPKPPKAPSNTSSKVIDKIATAGNKRVAFGNKEYPHSDRIILLAQSPAIVSFTIPQKNSNPSSAPNPSESSASSVPANAGNSPVSVPAEIASTNSPSTAETNSPTKSRSPTQLGTQANETSVAAPTPGPITYPSGYVLSTEDLLEIFPLVSRNTPVLIH